MEETQSCLKAAEKKQTGEAGDCWTWTSICDSDSKFIISWMIGDRSGATCRLFVKDVADRIDTRVQLNTDAYKAYLTAVDMAFGNRADCAMLDKIYGKTSDRGPQRKYSPGVCLGTKKTPVYGLPDKKSLCEHVARQAAAEPHHAHVHAPFAARLTNGFSKKLENHCNALALYFFHYNFCRIHKTLRTSPAQAAGVTDELLSMEHLCAIMDAANPAKKRGPYKEAQ